MDAYANKLTQVVEVPDGDARSRAGAASRRRSSSSREVTFTQGKGFTSLMTAPFTFVNKTTAPLYGVTGTFGDSLTQGRPRPDQARGPVHAARLPGGRSVQQPELADPPRRLHPAQRAVRDDPRSAAEHPPAAAADGDADHAAGRSTCTPRPTSARAATTSSSTRSASASRTTTQAGVSRTTENGVAIDATGTLAGTQRPTAFTDAVSESAAMAASPEARAATRRPGCATRSGAPTAAGDSCAVAALATQPGRRRLQGHRPDGRHHADPAFMFRAGAN